MTVNSNFGNGALLRSGLLLLALVLASAGCSGSRSDAESDASDVSAEQSSASEASSDLDPAEDVEALSAEASEAEEHDHSDEMSEESAHDHEAEALSYVPIEACLGRDVAFAPYSDVLSMSCDDDYLYIETENLADHEMMVGITAWNGQVPLPHVFYGDNAWAIPLHPVFNETVAETPGLGPIAVAINGVMIFNPTQQSGVYSLQTDPNLIGELDHCGGHSGRGDDYHYHVAPSCLEEEQVASDTDFGGVVAYAMDGYAVYANSAIPEGAVLDECGGLGTSADDYRYFASVEYPYVNGCFRGDFDMSLQPHAPGIRDIEAGSPKQVEITSLYTATDGWTHMEYLTNGVTASVNYVSSGDSVSSGDACFDFEFVDDISTGEVRKSETYCRK